MTTFDNIKKYAKKRGISLTALAEKIGMSRNSLYRYNQGVTPKYQTLDKIAMYLQVPLSSLSDLYNDVPGSDKVKELPKEEPKSVDLSDEDLIMSFEGQEIPEEDREVIINLLRGLKQSKQNK